MVVKDYIVVSYNSYTKEDISKVRRPMPIIIDYDIVGVSPFMGPIDTIENMRKKIIDSKE